MTESSTNNIGARWSSLFGALALTAGCNIGVSQGASSGADAKSTGTPLSAAAASALKSCPDGAQMASDGLLDDFEDGNSQLVQMGGRDGYWWKHHDPNGSTIEPAEHEPEAGGIDGSTLAVHIHGRTSSTEGAYGSSMGVNLRSEGVLDASKYAGVSFLAKAGEGSTKTVRFKVGDVNTHPDAGGNCKDCWNHFGKDIKLTEEWKRYDVTFAEMRQAPGWGDPRPPSISPDQLYNLDFTIGPGANFDIWLDDVYFFECKQ